MKDNFVGKRSMFAQYILMSLITYTNCACSAPESTTKLNICIYMGFFKKLYQNNPFSVNFSPVDLVLPVAKHVCNLSVDNTQHTLAKIFTYFLELNIFFQSKTLANFTKG